MPTRRDVLRILIASSGALYLGPALGSCSSRKGSLVRSSGERQRVEHQSYQAAHRYIRDHQTTTLDWNAAERHSADVVIVGAGPAGIAAAVQLHTAGYQIALIENEHVPGGAARAGTYNDVHYPLGSIYYVEHNAAIEDLCRFAGVTPVAVPDDTLVLNGTSYHNLWDDATIALLPVGRNEKDSLRRFRDDLLRMRERDQIPGYPLPSVLPNQLRELDHRTGAEFVARYRCQLLYTVLDMYARSAMGASLDQVNAYALLNFYANEINVPRFTFSGGLGGLVLPIANKLGDATVTGRTCIRITNDGNNANVWAIDQEGKLYRYQARAVIVAIQKFMLPWIIPDLPEPQQAAIRSLHYAPFLTVHLCSSTSILPAGFDIWLPEGDTLFTDIINANATLGSAATTTAVASIYAPRSPSERAVMQSDDVLAAFARKIAERALQVLPEADSEAIEEIHVFGWGHALVVPVPGSHSGTAQRAQMPFGRILFANTDNDSAPAFENAVAHGVRAAEQVIELLKR